MGKERTTERGLSVLSRRINTGGPQGEGTSTIEKQVSKKADKGGGKEKALMAVSRRFAPGGTYI